MTINPLLLFRAVGLLGGTFDPVHEGHLAIACAVSIHFDLDQVRLIPARAPVHRATPTADAHHRLAMLRLAIAPYPELAIDTREIDSPQQNYTLWTLQSLHAEQPDAALLWIIGEDAFAQLPGWYRWQELFDVAHFVVINRGGTNSRRLRRHPLWKGGKTGARRGQDGGETEETVGALPEILQEVVASRLTEDKHALTSRSAGLVYYLALPPQPASGTQIRTALAAGCADNITDLLPAPVLAYIARHALYQVTTHGG